MRFYVNKKAQSNGDHEVHRATCSWLPEPENRQYLGDFATPQQALIEAKSIITKWMAATTVAQKSTLPEWK